MASNITPGTAQYGVIANPTGKAESTTQIGAQLTPVEHGRTAAKSAYTTTASTGPIGGVITSGGVVTTTTTGTVSTKADGTYSNVTLTTYGSGRGVEIEYTVASNVAGTVSVTKAGNNYVVGENLVVTDDTGVTLTVASIS